MSTIAKVLLTICALLVLSSWANIVFWWIIEFLASLWRPWMVWIGALCALRVGYRAWIMFWYE